MIPKVLSVIFLNIKQSNYDYELLLYSEFGIFLDPGNINVCDT